MASKEDKLLAALRSLSPPKGGDGGEAPLPPDPSRPGKAEEDAAGPRGRRRTIELSIEEVGVFFLAATMLVVLAFLMGWYGRGVALPVADPNGKARVPAGREARLPRLSMDGGVARDLGARGSDIRPSGARRVVYTILAARFPGAGAGDAADHVALLEERGFVPAFLRPTRSDAGACTELCVGRFASQSDPTLVDWLPKVRQLRGAFAGAVIAQIPEKHVPDRWPRAGAGRASPHDTGGPRAPPRSTAPAWD